MRLQPRYLFGLYLVSTLLALTFCSTLSAQNRDWMNSASGSWFGAGNWNPADVPNSAGEIARFNAGGTYEISHLGGSTTVGGIDWTDAGATLTIGATGSSSSSMVVGSDFTINGTLNLNSNFSGINATLTGNGSITNSASGIVNFNGTSNVIRQLNTLEFNNNGIVNVDQNARFNTTNTLVNNNSTFNVASGATLDFGSNATFNQNGGTFDNQGTFVFSSDTLNFNGGNFTGNAVELAFSTLNNNTTGTGVFNMTGSGNYSGDLVAGQELNLLATVSAANSTIATADFTNFSTINMTSNVSGVGVTLTRNGTVINDAAGTINTDGTSTALRQLNIAEFINNGNVNVDQNTRFNTTNTIVTNNSAFNIANGKTLDFGSNATFNQNGGTVDNQGTFVFNSDTLNFNGGNFTGNAVELSFSTLNNNTTGTGVFNMTGTGNYSGDLVAGQELNLLATVSAANSTFATADFTNFSTINMTSDVSGVGVTLTRNGTVINDAAGTINTDGTSTALRQLTIDEFVNNGNVNVDQNTRFNRTSTMVTNNSTINIANGKTLDFGSNATFNQNGGTVDNQGAFVFSSDTLNFNGGNFTGNAVELAFSTLNNNTTGTGVFNMTGTGNYSGDLVEGQELNLLATVSAANSTIATADFTNFSTINMTSNASGVGVTLTRNGTVINDAAGTINVDGTSTALRQLNIAEFINNGNVNVDQNTRFNSTSTQVNNNSAINIASGKTLDFGSNATFNQNGGTVDNQGSFVFSSDTLNFNGGNFTGNAVELAYSTLNNNSTGTGVFNMTGSGFYSGDLVAGQELNLLATVSAANSTTATADFTNYSTINMTSNVNGVGVTLSRSGTITNAATGVINLDGSGTAATRTIGADIINEGLINNDHAGITNLGLSDLVFNSGTIVNRNESGTLNLGPMINQVGGVLTGVGVVQINAGGYSHDGTIAPGIDGAGILRMDGVILLNSGSSGVLDIEIGGLNPGIEYDRLWAPGANLNLGGTLSVSFINDFQDSISSSDYFEIIDAGPDMFHTFDGLPEGSRVYTSDGYGSFKIGYFSGGSSSAVFLYDFQAAIPEPSTAGLLIGAFAGLVLRRRRKV